MKEQRHKRREAYSVLIVSNLNRESRQFHIARSGVRVLACLAVLLCIAVGGLACFAAFSGSRIAGLQQELSRQEEQAEAWIEERNELNSKNKELETELASLTQELSKEQSSSQKEAEAAEAEADAEPEPPGLYPSSGVGSLTATYSEEHPYISISTYQGGDIIAAGDGTVAAVLSDDTYKYVIEIEHEGGYKTRYFYKEDAELKTEQGAQVKGGDVLLTVAADGADLDYQVLYQEEVIDPFSVIDAEG